MANEDENGEESDSESESESEIYETFELGSLTQDEVREINRAAPPGQRLQDVISPKKGRKGKPVIDDDEKEIIGKRLGQILFRVYLDCIQTTLL